MINLKVENNRLILGQEGFDSKRPDKTWGGFKFQQKEGISCLKGFSAKIQKKLGLAEDVILNGQTFTINKKSRNKWLLRTTSRFELKTITSSSKNHKIMNLAIESFAHRANILANHTLANHTGSASSKNLSLDNLTQLFNEAELELKRAEKADLRALKTQAKLDAQAEKADLRASKTQAKLDAQAEKVVRFKESKNQLLTDKAKAKNEYRVRVLAKKNAYELKPLAGSLAMEKALLKAQNRLEKAKGKLFAAENAKPSMAEVLAGTKSPSKDINQAKLELKQAERAVSLILKIRENLQVQAEKADLRALKAQTKLEAQAEKVVRFKESKNQLLADKAKVKKEHKEQVLAKKKAFDLKQKAWGNTSGADVVTGRARVNAPGKVAEKAFLNAQNRLEKAKGKLFAAENAKPSMAEVLAGTKSPSKDINQAKLELKQAEKDVLDAKASLKAAYSKLAG